MTQYFENCKTLDDLRVAYRKLAAIHHPDIGGDVATEYANICSTKKRAEEIVEFWNSSYKANGTYFFDGGLTA